MRVVGCCGLLPSLDSCTTSTEYRGVRGEDVLQLVTICYAIPGARQVVKRFICFKDRLPLG
jgi:hypothetical protein